MIKRTADIALGTWSRTTASIGALSLLMLLALAGQAVEIFDAVRAGDVARVKTLLDKDPSLVNTKAPNGLTLLHAACGRNASLEMVRLLVDRGADVNAVMKYSGRPLDLASEGDNAAIIQYLKSEGAPCTPLDFDVVPLAGPVRRIAYPWGMRNNIIVSAGSDGALVVDTGFRRRAVDEVRRIIRGFGAAEIKVVINTHSHGDHVAGNSLAPAEAGVIGLQKLSDESLKGILVKEEKPLRGPAGRTLAAPYVLRFNGEDIRLIPCPGLHSNADILIHFSKSGILCLGDLLLSQNCPAVQDVAGYMNFLDTILDVFPEGTLFVSGHGRDLDKAGLKRYREDHQAMIDVVKSACASGQGAEDMIRLDVLKAFKAGYSFLDWLGPDSWIAQIARAVQEGRLK